MQDAMENWNLLVVFYGYATYAGLELLNLHRLAAFVL